MKKNIWEIAVGLNKVDDLKPSKYLRELIENLNSLSSKSFTVLIETKSHSRRSLSIFDVRYLNP